MGHYQHSLVLRALPKPVARLLLVALLLVGLGPAISGCAGSPPPPVAETFPVSLAERTFAKGLRQISERYIESIPVEDLALEGLRGLASIDDRIGVRRDGRRVTLNAGDRLVERFLAPHPEDTEGWARLTVNFLIAGRRLSSQLRAARPPLIYKAVFEGMFTRLDNFSRYASAEKATDNRARRSGFGGIGVRFRMREDGARVSRVFAQSPAAKAGIQKNDLITHVQGKPIGGLEARRVRGKMRGAIGSLIALQIRRGDDAKVHDFTFKRARIHLPTVSVRKKGGIIHLRVSGFNRSTAFQIARKLKAARRELKQRAKGILLDLRGNPGGLLSQAVRVSDLFLTNGRIVSTRGRHPESERDYLAKRNDIARDLPIAVLIDGKSASAAEIVAAALQDQHRAVVIGSSSYGKGTVQTVARLPNDGELTLTWSHFVTPSGYVLHGLGVPPTVCTSNEKAPGTSPGRSQASDLVSSLLDHADAFHMRAQEWRSSPDGDAAQRRKLRAACPIKFSRPKLDLEVAGLLINNRDLYRRIIALSPVQKADGS